MKVSLSFCLVGLIAGWLAGQIVRGTGFGLVADLCIGIIGAFIGDWILPRLGIHLGSGIVAAIIAATIGAILLLIILRLVNRRGRWCPPRAIDFPRYWRAPHHFHARRIDRPWKLGTWGKII